MEVSLDMVAGLPRRAGKRHDSLAREVAKGMLCWQAEMWLGLGCCRPDPWAVSCRRLPVAVLSRPLLPPGKGVVAV